MSIKGYRIDENISKSLTNLDKSVKDHESVDANLRDEVKAISAYDEDEEKAKDPKVKKLFSHIKGEEKEHKEELENALVGKSVDMFRTPKYSTPFSTKPSKAPSTGGNWGSSISKPLSAPNIKGAVAGQKRLYKEIGRPLPTGADVDLNAATPPSNQWKGNMKTLGSMSPKPATPKPVTGEWKKNMNTLKTPQTDMAPKKMKKPSYKWEQHDGKGKKVFGGYEMELDLMGGGAGAGMSEGGRGAGVCTIGQGSYPSVRKRVKKAIHDATIALGVHMFKSAIAKCEGGRKHTPIVSDAQRRLFGAVLSGNAKAAPGLTKKEAKRHLEEVKGDKLPEKVSKKKEAK